MLKTASLPPEEPFSTLYLNPSEIASLIDHTLLKPEAARADIERLCGEAREWGFASVCVNPCWVPECALLLRGAPSRVCTVIGFPLGANARATKIAEARLALDQGALEIDMVQNVGALRSGDADAVREEISEIVRMSHGRGAIVKVILETCLLTRDEIRMACSLTLEADADFVKTSTGFGSAGATVDDVRLMREAVGLDRGVKASGGIRSLHALLAMTMAGASRIGTSSGVAILQGLDAVGNAVLGEATY